MIKLIDYGILQTSIASRCFCIFAPKYASDVSRFQTVPCRCWGLPTWHRTLLPTRLRNASRLPPGPGTVGAGFDAHGGGAHVGPLLPRLCSTYGNSSA